MHHSRLLSRLCNTPLAIEASKLEVITSNVSLKLLTNQPIQAYSDDRVSSPKQEIFTNKPIVRIFDSLVSKNGAGASGVTSYENINSRVRDLVNAGHKTIYFYLDTPGGEVSGLFGLASFIHSLSSKYGIQTIGITDGMMASAGYVLGSAVDKVYATSSSIIGSIGVIMTLINVTEADKADGVKYTILRSKEEKALINPHEDTTDAAIKNAISMLTALDTIMNEKVLSFRPNLSLETIVNLKGNTVLAEEALSLGLIDGIVDSVDDIFSIDEERKKHFLTKQPKGATMTLEELQAENIRLSSEVTALKAELGLAATTAKKEEQDRVLGILNAAGTFGLTAKMATKRILANTSVEDTVSMFEDIAETMQDGSALDTTGAAASSTINKSTVTSELSFMDSLAKAIDNLDAAEEKIEWGVN